MSGGWNLTCTNSIEATWIPHSYCSGASSHRTTYVGASLLIEFEGTAAWVFNSVVKVDTHGFSPIAICMGKLVQALS